MKFIRLIVPFLASVGPIWASDLDTIGLTLLRQTNPNLNGSGIPVAQVEAGAPAWEINPAAVGKNENLFTWQSADGTATNFPNSLGTESGHADAVANLFFGSGGVATNVSHVYNYEAGYFYNSVVAGVLPPTISAKVANQSFVFTDLSTAQAQQVEKNYDNYAADKNVLFVSGIGNGGAVLPPGTAYNSIGVGAYGGTSSVGPTADGRCKPDITAPAGATSFSTPLVSGAAAILLQAANQGDGGANIPAASDIRTVKAILLNGAVKTADWTNSATSPLDARYGAGILNIFNSYKQLSGGKRAFIEATSNASNGAHPPGANTNNISALSGWDFSSISNDKITGVFQEKVQHYYFNLPATNGGKFTLTTTLAWNRGANQTSIRNLDLFLYNAAGTLVAASTSAVDNVEHIFSTNLPAGRYDLQVLKRVEAISGSETYALAFEFFAEKLNIARAGNAFSISWPVYPAGFVLESTLNLNLPINWSPIPNAVSISNNLNTVLLSNSGTNQFFRLRRP